MDEALIRANCRAYRAAFESCYPKNTICYAGKAFMTIAMCRLIDEEGLNLDVASLGELYTALRAGFPRKRINLHGNNKSREELELAVRSRIGHIVVDNGQEIQMLAAVTSEMQRTMRVLVRCTPGVDPHTHKFISTGQADTKFGFNIKDGSAVEAIRQIAAIPTLRFDGIHCHVGSQLLDTEAHEGATDAMVGLMQEIRRETGLLCEILNTGGGLGVRYRSDHQPPTYDAFARILTDRLKTALDRSGLPYPTLQQEPGRSLVGEAGTTLYTVGAIKTVPILPHMGERLADSRAFVGERLADSRAFVGERLADSRAFGRGGEPQVPIVDEPGRRTYVSVDGGLSDNPRPQLYDAVYEIIVANRAAEPHDRTITLAGKHCETDVLIWDVKAARVEPGDIVAVQTTGAYNYAMASNYNRFLRPAVVLVRDGQADLIVERETLADIVRHDRVPLRLTKGAARSREAVSGGH